MLGGWIPGALNRALNTSFAAQDSPLTLRDVSHSRFSDVSEPHSCSQLARV